MIKVLSGKYKGRKLNNFKLDIIRPTQAKVKKSIFDSIISLENKRILDLFSGVGTLGIESFSRGAKFVCFVEKNYQAVKLLRENLMMLDIKDRYSIYSVIKFLELFMIYSENITINQYSIINKFVESEVIKYKKNFWGI